MFVAPLRFAVVLAAGLAVCSGCGASGQSTITGTVRLDNAPLDTGTIEFRTLNGAGVVASVPITDGAFKVPSTANLPPGTYKILISSLKKTGKQIPVGSPAPPGTKADEVVESIPSKYNKSSTLTQELKAGQNTCDFALTSK